MGKNEKWEAVNAKERRTGEDWGADAVDYTKKTREICLRDQTPLGRALGMNCTRTKGHEGPCAMTNSAGQGFDKSWDFGEAEGAVPDVAVVVQVDFADAYYELTVPEAKQLTFKLFKALREIDPGFYY